MEYHNQVKLIVTRVAAHEYITLTGDDSENLIRALSPTLFLPALVSGFICVHRTFCRIN